MNQDKIVKLISVVTFVLFIVLANELIMILLKWLPGYLLEVIKVIAITLLAVYAYESLKDSGKK